MKNLHVFTLLLVLLFTHSLYAQAEGQFPSITGETLQHKMVELPGIAKGKYCLIGMAASKKAEADLQTWMQPVYDLFINQNTFIPIDYNLDVSGWFSLLGLRK